MLDLQGFFHIPFSVVLLASTNRWRPGIQGCGVKSLRSLPLLPSPSVIGRHMQCFDWLPKVCSDLKPAYWPCSLAWISPLLCPKGDFVSLWPGMSHKHHTWQQEWGLPWPRHGVGVASVASWAVTPIPAQLPQHPSGSTVLEHTWGVWL